MTPPRGCPTPSALFLHHRPTASTALTAPINPPLETSLPQQLQPITGKPAEDTDAHTCLDTC